jgi:hypothetical protein
LQLGRAEADLIDTQNAIGKQIKYSAAIREIEMAILELKFSMMQLQESLDVTSNGKLSSVLINRYHLSAILQQVSLQQPAGLSMLTGSAAEEMYVYYTVASVSSVHRNFFRGGVKQIQLRTEGRENGNLGAIAP